MSTETFHFPPAYADCLAHISANWANLEYMINSSIWELAETRPALGACITAQIVSLHRKLSALLALMKLREMDDGLITKVNKFSERVREPLN